MTMAFKYQVLLCPRPKDVLLVTFNHLDSIKGFIQDSPTIINQVDETFRQLTEVSPSPACHLPATALVLSQLRPSTVYDYNNRVKVCHSSRTF